ncbi:hypothetical protein NP233_g9364 [Leucocoprinus birnbaumii]|uniref:Nephrocystin 3-like N-terminal domain-containing protein n=1 Tax=Leucocoprinus birnbaumii TaxID=56174 RepID=A0AAD5VKW4_9AGAR|nr:hypothetical protein NP233_g9364 [Leucocoprinus birnbaumii]
MGTLVEVSPTGFAYISLGGFAVLFSVCSLLIWEKMFVNKAVLGVGFGILMGLLCAGIFDLRSWGSDSTRIMLEIMRVVLATGIFAIGANLLKMYMYKHLKGLLAMVVPTMAIGWVIVAGLLEVLFSCFDYVTCLILAACLTPTDPIVSAVVVGGPFAKKYVPDNLRHIITAETDQVILGIFIGAVIGYVSLCVMNFSYGRGYINRDSYVAQYLALSVFTMGVVNTIGSCAINWDGSFSTHTEDEAFGSVIEYIINCGCFFYIGTWLPWSSFSIPDLGISLWRLAVLCLGILLLRCIPVVMVLYRWVPKITGWKEALFCGHFGPMGVGAVFISTLALHHLPEPHHPPQSQENMLAITLHPMVGFIVLVSIVIYGFSILFFTLGRSIHSRTIPSTNLQMQMESVIGSVEMPELVLPICQSPTTTDLPFHYQQSNPTGSKPQIPRPALTRPPDQSRWMNNYVSADITEDLVMEKFAEHTIQGAELDSSACDLPPCCHPGTHISILKRMDLWIRNPCQTKRMLWLVGPAGVGKSAIMQTFAENECKLSLLAAIFFSAPNSCNDPKKVITTLAYQLAARYSPYCAYIRTMVTANLKVLEKSIMGQFTEFIVKSFVVGKIFEDTHPVLIFINSLDECVGEFDGGDPQLFAQSLHVKLRYENRAIRTEPSCEAEFPDVPLLWIVANCPEAHITHHLSRPRLAACFDKEEVPVDSPEAYQDVEQFVRVEFAKIQGSNSVIMSHYWEWPPEELLLKLLATAQGLFAYADMATRFIAECNHISWFQLVLNLIDQPSSTSPSSTAQPMARLDILYDYIVAQVDPNNLKYAKQIFTLFLFRPFVGSGKLSQSLICNWLEISSAVLHSSLCKLHSVLQIPAPHEYRTKIIWYHKSFYNFLHRTRLQLGLPMNAHEAAETSQQQLVKVLSHIPLTNLPTALEIPQDALSWPYQTLDEVKYSQINFFECLIGVDVGNSGLAGSTHEPFMTPGILHAVKAMASFCLCRQYLFDDIFFELTGQLREDRSLLDIPANVFNLDSIVRYSFYLIDKCMIPKQYQTLTDTEYGCIMHRWKTNPPEIMLKAFIGNWL